MPPCYFEPAQTHKIISSICLLQPLNCEEQDFIIMSTLPLLLILMFEKIFTKLTEHIVCSKREQETYQNKNGEINWLETTLHCDKVELESFI